MKSIVFAAQDIILGMNVRAHCVLDVVELIAGEQDVIVAAGMESMTNTPFMLQGARQGFKYGDQKLLDSLSFDGLGDAYSKKAMGCIGDYISDKFSITRKQQDDFALESYARAQRAQKVSKSCSSSSVLTGM